MKGTEYGEDGKIAFKDIFKEKELAENGTEPEKPVGINRRYRQGYVRKVRWEEWK